MLCFNSRFKRGGKNLKGGPDRIGLGFEEPNSKSSKMGSQDPLPEYLTSNSSITTRTDTTGKIRSIDLPNWQRNVSTYRFIVFSCCPLVELKLIFSHCTLFLNRR